MELKQKQDNDGTKTQAGIIRKKMPCYMPDSACRWRIVEKAKISVSYAKHFRIFPGVRSCRNLVSLCKYVFMN